MHQPANHQLHAPYLWVVGLTMLALITVTLVEDPIRGLAARWLSADTPPTLEPVFSPRGGYYEREIQLEIDVPGFGAGGEPEIIYTLDGSLPSRTVGSVYTEPIHIRAAVLSGIVVRARAVLPDGEMGPVVSASYFVGLPAELPMMSLVIDPGDLWDPGRGIYVNPHGRGEAWERLVDVTYVDRDRRSGFHVPAGVRIHGEGSRSFEKKSLRLYFRQEYGAAQLEYPLFADSQVRTFDRLVLHAGAQDHPVSYRWNWTLLRNQLLTNLVSQLGGHVAHSQPVLLFINGKLWGIYHVRERIDDRFLTDHYGIESADFLRSPGDPQDQDILMGTRESWDHLIRFIGSHDLSDPSNLAFVQGQVDVANLVDYSIFQIYAANANWSRRDVYQFRPRVQGGRWRWVFEDSDRSLGANPRSHVDLDLVTCLEDQGDPETDGCDTLLLRKLLENPGFAERFLARVADLLNTALAPSSVIARIDALAAGLAPDVAYETMRWPSAVSWEANVEQLRDFARRRPDFVRSHIVRTFQLDGTAELTLNPPASGAGWVAVNGSVVQDLPWQGIYFEGIPFRVTAVPAPGYRFVGWAPSDLPQTSTITLTLDAAQTLVPSFALVSEEGPRPGDVLFTRYRADGDGHIDGTWFELEVMRPGGVDLRGWRVTDNDTRIAMDEGSLIFADNPAFADVPQGTIIRISVTRTGDACIPQDDLDTWDRAMVLYAGNGNLDFETDPGFNLGPEDNLVLLAPGLTEAFGDDRGIAFATRSAAVTPASFGVLADGVQPTE